MPVTIGHPYYEREEHAYQQKLLDLKKLHTPSNFKLITEYLDERSISNARTYTKQKTSITTLRNIAATFCRLNMTNKKKKEQPLWKTYCGNKDFKDITILNDKNSLKALKTALSKKYDNGHTLYDFRKTLIPFFRYLNEGIQPTCCSVFLDISQPAHNKHYGKSAYTEDEIQAMIDTSYDVQDKCLIGLLRECPVRGRSSLLLLEKSHIEFLHMGEMRYAKINWMHGKTGAFQTTIYQCLPYLERWLSVHPLRDQKDFPIFVNTKGRDKLKRMGYNAFMKRWKAICQRTAIKYPSILNKPQHPHWMRASGFSLLEEKYGSTEAAVQGGWQPDSKQLRKYRNRAGESHLKARMQKDGINPEERKNVVCLNCHTVNEPKQEYCLSCASPVNVKSLKSFEAKVSGDTQDKVLSLVMELLEKSPEERWREYKRLKVKYEGEKQRIIL